MWPPIENVGKNKDGKKRITLIAHVPIYTLKKEIKSFLVNE